MNIQKYYTVSFPHTFAATYNCSAYGAGVYDETGECATTVAGGSDGASGGGLIDTGVHILLPIVVGIALIVAAVVLFVRRPKKQSAK